MSRTVNVNEEFVVVSKGKEDLGKFAVLGDGGKFDPSVIPVIDELQEQITKEVNERTAGDKALQTNIDTETSARISADQQLQRNIEAEASARDAADKDLEDKLAAEVTARTDADAQLQANLEAEASARATADKDLQDQISKEITARTDADSKLQSSIDNEVDARTKADQSLQDQLTAEIAARTNADETEANTRVSADKELQNKIDALEGKNAFSNVVVNGTTIKAASQEDTIELEAGTNIALTADTANEKVTIAVTGKVASAAQTDYATTSESCTGNAVTATQLATARTISLTGDVTGSGTFDGSGDLSITTTNGTSTSYVTAQSLGTNGYRQWSDGMIEQWGYQATTNSQFSFPKAFPNACLNFMASNANSQGACVDAAFGYPVSTSNFYLATKQSAVSGDGISGYACYWTARGY